MTALDCPSVLQARMPSYHVWRSFALPALPQFLNQEPPRPQQLFLPDFAMVPHLGHAELMVVVVAAGVQYSMGIGQRHKEKNIVTVNERRCIYVSSELTFAGLHALRPLVHSVSVAGTSPTVLKPSTARSATTDSAGFLERAALGARYRFRER